jgi:hypothetical protein
MTIAKFDHYTEKITWTDPETFKRNFDAHKLVDDMTGVIILKKNMTSADVLDAYLNGVHTIPIDLNEGNKK